MKDTKVPNNMKRGWLKIALERAAKEAKKYPKEMRERYKKDFPLPGVEMINNSEKFSSH